MKKNHVTVKLKFIGWSCQQHKLVPQPIEICILKEHLVYKIMLIIQYICNESSPLLPMAYFFKGVNSNLAKPPLKFNGSSAKLGLSSFCKTDQRSMRLYLSRTVIEWPEAADHMDTGRSYSAISFQVNTHISPLTVAAVWLQTSGRHTIT